MSNIHTDEELFQDAFGEWLKTHGVSFEQYITSKGFEAIIDLNKLKAAIQARDNAIRIVELENLPMIPRGIQWNNDAHNVVLDTAIENRIAQLKEKQ